MRFFTKQIDTTLTTAAFKEATPFPHVVVDNLLEDASLSELADAFPSVDEGRWWRYDNELEKKHACNDLARLPSIFKEFFDEANSETVVKQLASLSGLDRLVPDHALNGGGLHQIPRGGKLDVHEDYNVHKGMNAWRKLNVIVYLNKGWEESYGGHLELWNGDVTRCEKKVLPTFNRTVIFRTDLMSNHGHPDPLSCPSDRSRRSLACYYYVPLLPGETFEYVSTNFKRRPTDSDDPSLEAKRAERRRGRLT